MLRVALNALFLFPALQPPHSLIAKLSLLLLFSLLKLSPNSILFRLAGVRFTRFYQLLNHEPLHIIMRGPCEKKRKSTSKANSVSRKRSKLHHTKSTQPEAPAVSPTLTPALPEPLPPTITSGATNEEIAFFDRVKKFIGNKQTMNEFLKLCNLFSQDLIDKNVLVHKVASFIGGNPELMNWFKRFVHYDGRDEVIQNKPKAPDARVALSNCRGLGPSYRLLPKRERLKVCGGRDEMCYQVLNDEWASHPTWASEDSGFISHRKNMYEEALHRIEEERHDYDFNIETCLRTIQLLEPIVQQIKLMSHEERAAFVLPPGIGGQSETIYRRVIKKIYDRDRGTKVIEDMFLRPTAVVPIVLARLKQKAEEWKASQVSHEPRVISKYHDSSTDFVSSANGRRSGGNKRKRCSGRVWITKVSMQRQSTRSSSKPRPCKTRSRPNTRSRTVNVLSLGTTYPGINWSILSKILKSFWTPLACS